MPQTPNNTILKKRESDISLCQVYKGGGFTWEIPMRSEPNHIRYWHHSQPKSLRQWVYGSLFLYSALLSHFWSMWNLDLHLDS